MAVYDSVRYASLAGRSVLITGGASGIGAEMVRAFASQGAIVSCVDIESAGCTGTNFVGDAGLT